MPQNTIPETELYIGLMSGTSLNSIDAALVEFKGKEFRLLHTLEYPLDGTLRKEILSLCTKTHNEIHRVNVVDRQLGQLFAKASLQLLEHSPYTAREITAIGSHGQTIRHQPLHSTGSPAYSLQVGDPNTIAELTKIDTVADFRRRDIAAGGQAAPLAPAFHQFAFHKGNVDRCVINIGGISNITLLPAQGPIRGFDTGPGNVLLNEWVQKHKSSPFDKNGEWARSGQQQNNLLETLMQESYFSLAPPKSTGRELFNALWLEQKINSLGGHGQNAFQPEDVMCTLTELSAISISTHLRKFAGNTHEAFVCGGGANNGFLMERLAYHLSPVTVSSTDALGLGPDWVEAVCFAWLARQSMHKLSGNIPSVTGASGERILGGIYFADSINSSP